MIEVPRQVTSKEAHHSMDSSWLIENARILDPSNGVDRVGRLLIVGGKFAGIDVPDGDLPPNLPCIDGTNQIAAPGLVDLCTEFGEPGREEDETILSGATAALAGGFTSLALSTNTTPPIDSAASVEFIHQKSVRADQCRVYPLGCISKERKGETLAEIGSLVEAGAIGLYDGPNPIENTGLLKRALEYCSMFDKVVFEHPEIASLSRGGVMHEGLEQLRLGLPPIPAEAEDLATSRDIRLVEATGSRLHLVSISTSGSVEQCRRAKSRGIQFSVGAFISNLHLCDDMLREFNSNCKVNPPFRSREHVDALLEGLSDGTIDIISSGHTPCSLEKKMIEITHAPFGMVSLETTLAQLVTFLIRPGHLSWQQAITKMSYNPSKLLGLPSGSLEIGKPADLILIDPNKLWKVESANFKSRARNTPLEGVDLYGKVTKTFVGGRIRHEI